MADTSLLSRLDGIEARFEEVSTLITDPSVIADMKRYVRLTKEYKDLEKLTGATRRYRNLLGNIQEAREILDTENDDDMRAMAKEELDSVKGLLDARLIYMYETPQLSFLQILFESKNVTEFLYTYYAMKELAEYDAELLETVKKQKQDIETTKRILQENDDDFSIVRVKQFIELNKIGE